MPARVNRSRARSTMWALLTLAVPSLTVAAELVECIAVQVNDEIITRSELVERKKAILDDIYRAQLDEQALQNALESAGSQILPTMIQEKLLMQRARDLGLNASDDEVDRIVQSIMEQNQITDESALERQLAAEGMTLVQLRDNIARRSVIEKLKQFEIASKVVVTEEEAKRFYDAHRDEFREPERVRLRGIVLLTEQRGEDEVRKEIDELAQLVRNGADFAELATLFSHAPSAEHGGDLGLRDASELSAEIAETVTSLLPGEVSEPIKSRFGFHILKLVERKDTTYRAFEEAREAITAKVQQDAFDAKTAEYVEELKSKSFIENNDACLEGSL